MNAQNPTASPSCVSAVSPVQWLRTFAYTPDSARIVHNSGYRDSELAAEHNAPLSDEDSDVLPTQFHSRASVDGVPNPRRGPEQEDTSEANVSPPFSPFLTAPKKRKRTSGGREAPSLSSTSTPDGLECATQPSSSQRRTKKTRAHTRCMSPSAEIRRGHGLGQGLGPSHVPASPTRPRSRRVVLDAVEIVSKRRSWSSTADPRTNPTESAHKTASSHYPSPPVSRAPRDIVVHDGHLVPNAPNAVAREESISAEPTAPLKTSKYFACASAPQTLPAPENFLILTPPSSPMLTIPVYIESSDFEYPPLDGSFDEPVEGTVDESGPVPAWYNSPGLHDDLMIMLRRLKPILVQESVRDDPWKVLIAVRLLNVTTGKAAIPVFCKIISRWPTPQDLVRASQDELVELLRPLGLYNKRVHWLKDVSERFLEDQQVPNYSRTPLVSLLPDEGTSPHLRYPGVGPYALDSLRIFCADDENAWKHVMPRDKELVRYLRWRWAVEEGKIWYPEGRGVIGDVNASYLITLVDELAAHYDGAIGGEGYMYHFCNDLCGVLSGDMTGQSTS